MSTGLLDVNCPFSQFIWPKLLMHDLFRPSYVQICSDYILLLWMGLHLSKLLTHCVSYSHLSVPCASPCMRHQGRNKKVWKPTACFCLGSWSDAPYLFLLFSHWFVAVDTTFITNDDPEHDIWVMHSRWWRSLPVATQCCLCSGVRKLHMCTHRWSQKRV